MNKLPNWSPCEEMENEYNENQKAEKHILITAFVILHIFLFIAAYFSA